ncbi:MAG: DmsE family decaheme c-type cytochrome [Pyrinomonadaceae bacterium]
MASNHRIKLTLLSIFAFLLTVWAVGGAFPTNSGLTLASDPDRPPETALAATDDYLGSESCKDCHEDQFKKFLVTKHAKLKEIASWKDKAQGCESCHGPGKAHLEDATDPTRIISFKGKNSKEISETCLTCHAGRESHNNFRRGEHWRNDIGCTDCHTSHGSPVAADQAGGIRFAGASNAQNESMAVSAMLKASEPALCMGCHTDTKAQFSKPFRHKVMEGAMKCSSCHNAHGGFESKQTRLAVGADTACVKCHTNKQGPFVFEHAPLKTEGCAACHTPHGSSNPKMLTRSSVRQMCMECHSSITEQAAPGLPSFHNQANVRFKDCTVCHTMIHGSNSSSVFFR